MAYTASELTNLGRRIEHARYDSATLPTPVSADIIREWLCEARTLARTGEQRTPSTELLAVWGILLGNLIQIIKANPKLGDIEHLGEFLHAASRISPDELMHVKPTYVAIEDPTKYDSTLFLPVYDSLSFVTSIIRQQYGNVLLAAVLEKKLWEPSRLLRVLTVSLDAQLAYADSPQRDGVAKISLANTAFGELLLALQKTWLVSNWRPAKTTEDERDAYRYVWKMYPYLDWQRNTAEDEQHARIFSATITEFPEHGLEALEFIREKYRLAEVMLEAIFPVRFDLLDSKRSIELVASLLESLVRIGAEGLFLEMFAEFHPELNGLMQMHYAMYPVSANGISTVELDYLIGAWDAICKNIPQAISDPGLEYEVLGSLGSDGGP